MAFSYITNNTFLGREDIDLGLAGDHQQLIVYNLGKTFYIHYQLTPFQWHTICLIWDGVKGRLELFLNKERILVMKDQPQHLTPNGTLVLGHFLKKGDNQVKSMVPRFTNSLYYFQLWDHILGNEEFMKCLSGNVVSWEEDVWLVNKIIPTFDVRLRCFVYENITIQETSTTLSQQIDLTTPSQVTELKLQKTVYFSTMTSKSMPVFATDYTTRSYSNTISPPLETMTTPNSLKTPIAETATFAADILPTSAAIALSTKSTSIGPTTNSAKITKSTSSESTRTTRMAESVTTETFHPTVATNFLYTSEFTKNSTVSKTSVTGSQSAVMRTTSLFSSIESTSMPTTSRPKHKSTGIGASTASGSVPWCTVKQTSATTTHIGTASTLPPESVLISTATPVDSVFPGNQTASMLATTDMEIPFTVFPTKSIEMTPALRTAETKSTSINFQDVSSPRVEDTVSTSTPKEASSIALSFRTWSPFTRAQSVQTVIDAETTHTALTPGVTLAPMVAQTMLSPTITGPVYTQNTPTGGETMLPLISTESASTSKAFQSGPTSITDEDDHLPSTNEITWTSRPDQTLLTSAFHGSTSNTEHASTNTNTIIPPETSTENEATTTTDATTDRHTTVLSNLTSPRFANFSTVTGTTTVTKLPECKLTTLLLKTTPTSTVAENELLSTPRETVVLPVDIVSTLADIEPNFSTEESASENTQTETNGIIAFGETTDPVPESATTERFKTPVTREETTSHYLTGKLTPAATTEVSPFATMLEATDESVSPFLELTARLDNKTATTEVRGSWFSTKLVKTTPKSSYNGTTEIFNSTHIYTANWTSETLPKGNPTPSPTSGSTQSLPKPLDASTTLGTSYVTIPTDRTAVSLSAGSFPPQPAASHSSAPLVPSTHMFSLPVHVSAVASMVVSEETKAVTPEPSTLARASSTSLPSDVSTVSSAVVTTASVPPLDQTASTTSDTIPTHRDSLHTASEATVISVRMTPTPVPSLTETLIPSLRPPTPVATKAETTLLSTSADTVTPSRPILACSKSPPDNTPVVSSTHVTSSLSTPLATQPISQAEETSTHALSFPYTFSGSGDAGLATGTTETSVVDETVPSHISANKLITSGDGYISQPSTRLVNTRVPTLLVTDDSTLSSSKEQMTTFLGKTPRTPKMTDMPPPSNLFISVFHTTSSLEMTDTGFSETTEVSSHQAHSHSGIPFVTPPNRSSASSPTSGGTQTIPTSTSRNTVDVHVSEMSTGLGKTALPTQSLTITSLLSPEKESLSVPSVYIPRTEETIVSPTPVTHPFSHRQDTSFVEPVTSRTTRISNSININATRSHLLSPRTQADVSSVASFISESTQTSPQSLSLSTARLSSASPTASCPDRVATALSTPNVPAALRGGSSMATSIRIYQMSPLPVHVTAFTSKRVSDTPAAPTTKSCETAHPDCWKSSSAVTSGPMSEMSSVSVHASSLSPPAVSSDASTMVGSFYTLLSAITPRTSRTTQTSALDVTPGTYAGPTLKTTVVSSAFTSSEITEVSSRITPTSFSSSTEPAFPSVKTIPTTIMAEIVTPFIGTTASSLLSSKNTEAISSIPKTTFSPFLSTTQQLPQGDEATTLGILSGISNSSLATVNNGKVTALTNTYSRPVDSESVLSSTPSENLHTSLNIQVSPSLTSFKSTPGPTKSVKATIYLSSNTEKTTSLSENTSTAELTKGAMSVNTPVSYPPWIPSSTTPPSLTSLLFSPHSPEAEFSSPKTSLPPTSQMVEFPVLGTRTSSSNTQLLLTTSWNTPTAQFSISTTTHIPTPSKMETESSYLVPETLSTLTASQTGLVSGDVMAMSAVSTTGILPTLGVSESPSLSISSRSILTTLADIKHTFEKTTTSVTPGTTLPSHPSGAPSGSIISKVTTSPMLTWILSSLPSGSPLATMSNAPHMITSSTEEVPKSTVPTSDITPTHPFTNITILPFAGSSAIPTKTIPTPVVGSLTTGFPTSFPMSIKITDDSAYISKSPEEFSRITVTADSRTVSQPLFFSRMSKSPPTIDYTLSIGSMLLPSSTATSAWSRIPAASASPNLVLPKPTQDSLLNTAAMTSTAPGASFPLIPTGVTHPSTATVSSLPFSSFETTWLDSTPSFLSTETLTSPIAAMSKEPGKCKAEETASKYKGTYKWLLTNPTETAQTRCIKNEAGNATRVCSININSGKSHWEKPKFKQCKLLQELPNKIVDLANITISDENANDVAEHILNLINESPLLGEEETKIIVSKVSDVSQCDEISMNLTQTILQIIDAALGKQNNSLSDLHEVSNEILRIIERAGHKMEFSGRTANLTVARLALAVLRVDHTFEGMAFSIRSFEEGTDPETKNVAKALTTYVVSASISDTSIQNLADPVVITLQHIEGKQNYDQVQCAFWDFGNNNEQGGWNASGCKVKETNANYTICQCDHLTHFGVLMDLSRSAVDAVNERILVLITYTGCGISSIFLGVAMVTYIAFHKLRKDHPSKILINLCTALLMLNLVFLLNSWSSSFPQAGLCITAAVALHYFLLVSLTWMGLEAVHMYLALVKVFNIYIPNYILKLCLAGWGIPAIVVAIILSVKKDLYGTLSSTTPFCWIKDDPIFYISVAAYFCLIFLMNLSMFCTVLVQLNSMKTQSQKTRRRMILQDLKGTTSLTFLLGLTWGFAFFAWGPVRILFLYLFAIFNTLQDGSSRCGLHVGRKQERLKKTFEHSLLPPSLKSSAISSIFKSSGSVQGTPSEISSPNDNFDEDPNCFSPLSCEAVPNCVRRLLPVEIKMNSIDKQRFLH
nr:adhesion G-protein coupled receptor G4 [Vicugna pacos]